MSASNFSRRQWLAGTGSITAALVSSSCASAVREEKILNLMVHGAFALELSDTELVLRAPALLGHVYGARCGTAWLAPKRKSEFTILGLSSGTNLDRAIYLDRAQQTFPHVKHALLRPELEYWTLRLPIPIDVRGFRQVEARGDETALSGSSLQNPIWERVPSVLLLRRY